MAIAVNIAVESNDLVPVAIAGAQVVVYDPANQYQVAGSDVSDANGIASFLLPGAVAPGKSYEVRVFKLGVIFPNPTSILVVEPGTEPLEYVVQGQLTATPVATDPRLCRCRGRFVNQSNQPRVGLDVIITSKPESGFEIPKVVDGNMVTETSKYLKTDASGYVAVDLFRGGEYYITFGGTDDIVWNFMVPDRSSANLIELIHPSPVSLTWDQDEAPDNAASVVVAATLEVPMSVLFTDYQTIEEGLETWLTLSSSDTALATVSFGPNGGSALIQGIAPGVVTISCRVREGLMPSKFPYPALVTTDLTITVAPQS